MKIAYYYAVTFIFIMFESACVLLENQRNKASREEYHDKKINERSYRELCHEIQTNTTDTTDATDEQN